MNYFLRFAFCITTILLSSCAITSRVVENAEGKYLSYRAHDLKHAANIGEKSILLCINGEYTQVSGLGSETGEGDFSLLLPSSPPSHKTYAYKVSKEKCEYFLNNMSHDSKYIQIYTINATGKCANTDNCKYKYVTWELYNNSRLLGSGELYNNYRLLGSRKVNKIYNYHLFEDFNEEIIKQAHNKTKDKNAIYALKSSYYKYQRNSVKIYYINESKISHINLGRVYREGNSAWYALTPLSIVADIITSPIQLGMLIYGLKQLDIK
ncbi:MAG: hypothetical protein OQK82_03865 [Candidatus Pacearchaeota archaeon]|nr:hypothetical protein [Candidatus Pacearchaeota archaeon]